MGIGMNHSGLKPAIAALVAAALLMVAYALTSSPRHEDDYAAVGKRISRVMQRHDEAMGRWLDSVADTLANTATITFPQQFADPDYSLYVFDADTLRLWHEACLPTSDIRPATLERRILVSDNGTYFIRHLRRGTTAMFALLRVRSHSPYDNEYLADRYHPSLDLGEQARISTSHAAGATVTAPDGTYLFTVTGDASCRTSRLGYVASILLLVGAIVLTLWAIVRTTSVIASLGRGHGLALLSGAAMLAILYGLSLLIPTPASAGDTSILFSPLVFSYDWWLPSLGYMVLGATLLLTWDVIFFRIVKVRTRRRLALVLTAVAPTIVTLVSFSAIEILAHHSQGLSFYVGYISLSATSLIKIGVLSMLYVGPCLVLDRCYSQVSTSLSVRMFGLTAVGASVAVLLAGWAFEWAQPWFHALSFAALSTLTYIFKRHSPSIIQFSHFVWTMMLIAILASLRLTMVNAEKEAANRKLLSVNLSFQIIRDDDPIAEQQLPMIQSLLTSDTTIRQMMAEDEIRQDQLFSHVRGTIFGGYFSRYDLQVIPCRGFGSTVQMTNTGDVFDCAQYFDQLCQTHGARIATAQNFYRLDNEDGRPCYLGKINYGSWSSPCLLFVQLMRKMAAQGVGYPELLTNKRDRMDEDKLRGYSYARYADDRLVSSYGAFDYPLCAPPDSTRGFTVIESGDYSHMITEPSPNQTIVVSYPLMSAQDFLTSYSYIFLGMLIVCSLILSLTIRRGKPIWRHASLSERLHGSLVAFVLILFVILCGISIIQSIRSFETTSRERLSDAMLSVVLSLSDEFPYASPDDIAADIGDFKTDNILQRSSDAFNADAHLFSTDGRLVGTSRRELFMSGTTAPLMNDEALALLRNGETGEAFVKERIGSLLHYALYAPLANNKGEVIGYVNVPYFSDLRAMRSQMMQTLLPITNSIMLIIFLAIIFSHSLAYGVTRSLGQLRDMIQTADLGARNGRLAYPYDDEVGQIVKAYNKMTRQLETSAERLAASERESTWREMARQVAHEIKNPLTPMKLSVQYLLRVWDSRRENFEPMLKKTSQTLIEQIDQLAAVASQFSGVAKMKQAEPERMDIAARLASICSLFARAEESRLTYQGPQEGIFVIADPDLMTSVFNNLIKNAQQSAKDGRTVDIVVSLAADNHSVMISVADNGDGIADDVREKVFRPNFTTKSTGMGLGLAITKTIVSNTGGQIDFATRIGRGTTFNVKIPRCQ